jgi:hypothetical protein
MSKARPRRRRSRARGSTRRTENCKPLSLVAEFPAHTHFEQGQVQIARVPARFANRPCGRGQGAASTFLLCPGCQSRRRKLYIVGPKCRCRDCHRLGFAVEAKGTVGRSLQKAAKARAKLGAAPGVICPVPQRFVPLVPRRGGRGAGRRKYDRLVCQIAEADRSALSGIMAAADRLASSM